VREQLAADGTYQCNRNDRLRAQVDDDPSAACRCCSNYCRGQFSRQYEVVPIPSGPADQDSLPFINLDSEL
jgi:hypothetical protein